MCARKIMVGWVSNFSGAYRGFEKGGARFWVSLGRRAEFRDGVTDQISFDWVQGKG